MSPQNTVTHDKAMEQAYNAGCHDGKNNFVFRNTKLVCVCRGCREAYKMGYENGEKEAKCKDDD